MPGRSLKTRTCGVQARRDFRGAGREEGVECVLVRTMIMMEEAPRTDLQSRPGRTSAVEEGVALSLPGVEGTGLRPASSTKGSGRTCDPRGFLVASSFATGSWGGVYSRGRPHVHRKHTSRKVVRTKRARVGVIGGISATGNGGMRGGYIGALVLAVD